MRHGPSKPFRICVGVAAMQRMRRKFLSRVGIQPAVCQTIFGIGLRLNRRAGSAHTATRQANRSHFLHDGFRTGGTDGSTGLSTILSTVLWITMVKHGVPACASDRSH
ncbi:hypothetical protein [Azospirillum endophyticum]